MREIIKSLFVRCRVRICECPVPNKSDFTNTIGIEGKGGSKLLGSNIYWFIPKITLIYHKGLFIYYISFM